MCFIWVENSFIFLFSKNPLNIGLNEWMDLQNCGSLNAPICPAWFWHFLTLLNVNTNRQINKIEATHQIIRRKKKTETSTCSFANKKNVRIRIVCWKVIKCKVPSKFIHKLICSSSSKGHLIHHWKRKKKTFFVHFDVCYTHLVL